MTDLLHRRGVGDVLRVALLLAAAIWAASPFLTRSLIGGGDAVWYHHQIADAVTQFRSGVFPVFVGQTHYSFNGAVHPIRTAPSLQYAAGLLDAVTGQRLGFAALLNLTAFFTLAAAIVLTYVALVWLDPAARWQAAGLAWIYFSAPAVLALPFAQDLYMSTMATPWVPLVVAAALQAVRRGGRVAPVILGAGLGALWWAHSPIALWTTLVVAALFVVEAIGAVRSTPRLKALLRTAAWNGAALVALGSYPIVSVLLLRAPGERIVPRVLDRQHLLNEIQGAFPAIVQPLSLERPLLTFLQPGYPVLLALLLALIASFVPRRRHLRALWVLLGCAALYLILILPVPGITAWLWQHLPEMWASMTNIWPMQRLGVIIAAMAVVALQVSLHARPLPGKGGPLVRGLWAAALVWSGMEVGQIRDLAQQRMRPEVETANLNLEENVNVSEYCYQQLPQRPAYFIHGVTDPRMEVRLLDPGTQTVRQSNKLAAASRAGSPWIPLVPAASTNPAVVAFEPGLTLQPSVRYLVTFDFAREDLRGVLRFTGETLQRVYILPSAGDDKAFGTGPTQEKSLTLWTSRPTAEVVRMDFIPQPSGSAASAAAGSFGRIRIDPIVPEELPIQVTSLLPLRLTVRTDEHAWLETMRVFVPGWRARVDGQDVPVQRSSEGLVAVEVPAGTSQVEVVYAGPLLVRVGFWANLAAAIGALLAGVVLFVRRSRALVQIRD